MNFSNHSIQITIKLLIITFFTVSFLSTSAQVWHWNGSDNSDYDNPANWDSGTAPPDGVDVYIHGNSDHYPIVDDFLITVRHLRINEGASLTIDADPGLGVLNVNSIFVDNDATLTNRGRIILWHAEQVSSTAVGNLGTIDNASVGNIIPESGLFTITSFFGNGIANQGSISNSGKILITGTEFHGIQNGSSNGPGNINNSGTITIKDVLDNGIKQVMTDVPSTFTNSGTLSIDGTGIEGIKNHGILKNTSLGQILIGQDDEFTIGSAGIDNNGSVAEFENNGGLLKIDRCPNGYGIRMSNDATGENKNEGQILIGQSLVNGINQSGMVISNSTFTNDNADIIIDNINAQQISGLGMSINGSVLQNLNGGQLLIGITQGSTNGAGISCGNSTLNNIDSYIKIANTSGYGIQLGTFGFLFNLGSSSIDIGSEGPIDGVGLVMSPGAFSNENSSVIKINNTALAGLDMTDDAIIVNKDLAKFYIGNQGPIGTDNAASNHAIRMQGIDNVIENQNCAEIHLYKQVNFGTSSNLIKNLSYLYVESDVAHEGNNEFENYGVVTYIYDHIIPNTLNFGAIVEPVVLEGCIINNVIDIHNSNNYTFASTWYGDPAKTKVMGQYSSANNTFTMVNLPSESPAIMYFDIAGNNCSKLAKVGLIIEDYADGVITWTGAQSTNWHTHCNWNPEVVPGVNANIVIPNTSNDPIIKSGVQAFGKTLHLESNSSLVINSSNTLTLSGAESFEEGLLNEGTITNHGTIIVKESLSNLIDNKGTIVNQTSGQIQLFECTGFGITQGVANTTITNNGLLEIYNIGSSAIQLSNGMIQNNHMIEVGYKGENTLDNVDIYGLNVSSAGVFNNATTASFRMKFMSSAGIGNLFGTVNNNGSIEIDYTGVSGVWNLGTFSNNGTLKIGMNGAVGNIPGYGILQSLQTFENLGNGIIEIDNTIEETIGFFGGNLENSGDVFSHGQIAIDPSRTLRLKSGRFEVLND